VNRAYRKILRNLGMQTTFDSTLAIVGGLRETPMISALNIHFEMAERSRA
jgi:hypothetical protein